MRIHIDYVYKYKVQNLLIYKNFRKQIKEKSKLDVSYQSRFERLKNELNRPVVTSDYIKQKHNKDLPHIPSDNFNTKDMLFNDMPVVTDNGLLPSSVTVASTTTKATLPSDDLVVKSILSKKAPLDDPEALPPTLQQLPIDDMQRYLGRSQNFLKHLPPPSLTQNF